MADENRAAEFTLAVESLRRYPADSAHLLENAPLRDSAALVGSLSAKRAVAVLERLTPETASRLLPLLPEKTVRPILSSFDPSRAAGILARMDTGPRERLSGLLEPSLANELQAPHCPGAAKAGKQGTLLPVRSIGSLARRLLSDRNANIPTHHSGSGLGCQPDKEK